MKDRGIGDGKEVKTGAGHFDGGSYWIREWWPLGSIGN